VKSRLDPATPLLLYPSVGVRLRSYICPRNADVRLAVLASRCGHRVPVRTVSHASHGQCRWDPYPAWLNKPPKYGHRCGANLPDLNSTQHSTSRLQ
jgi:hypothetical protein